MATFALLDAARAPVIPELLAVSELEWCCLFSGKAGKDLATVAPYLVKLNKNDSFTRRLFTRADMPDVLWDQTGVVADLIIFRDSRRESGGLRACHEQARTCPLRYDQLAIL